MCCIFKRYKDLIERSFLQKSEYRKNLLKNIDHEFTEEQYNCRSKDGKKGVFTRERFFTIKNLVVIIMLLKTSYQRELDKFCKTLIGGDFNVREVTKGALSQARAKLNPWAFERLNEVSVQSFYEGAEYTIWEDMRILAVYGSRLRLPKSQSIIEEFGEHGFGPNADSKACMATCSLLYDVLNHITIDAQIGPYTESEKSLLDKHLPKLEQGDLLLADRGYPSLELMLKLGLKQVEFCFRMKENWWLDVKDFVESGEMEKIVEFEVPKKIQQLFNQEDRQSKIKCRLIKIELDNGEIEVLCTSLLDQKKYEYDQFEALYHVRWDVEEAFKLLKSRVEIEAFSGKTERSVYQDFHAKVLMMTLCAALAYPIEQKVKEEYKKERTGNKYDQQINKTSALSITKENLVQILLRGMHQKGIDCMDAIIENTRDIIRQGRHFERNKNPKRLYHTCYKPIA